MFISLFFFFFLKPLRLFCFCTQLANEELSELQSELETLTEKNQQAEVDLAKKHGVTREKVCLHHFHFEEGGLENTCGVFVSQAKEMGRLLLAIDSLAQQCYLPAYGPLETMNTLTKMDMVKVLSSWRSFHSVRTASLS